MQDKTLIQKIAAITGELGAINKERKKNSALSYGYQSIDDVVNALNPLLAKYEIAIFEEIISLETSDVSIGTKQAVRANVQIAYHVTDGKTTIVTHGAAIKIDYSDKSVTQAMSMAYKYAMIRLFAIRTNDTLDPDEFTSEHYVPVSQMAKEKQETKRTQTAEEKLAIFQSHVLSYIELADWQLFSRDHRNALYAGYYDPKISDKDGYLKLTLSTVYKPLYNLTLLK